MPSGCGEQNMYNFAPAVFIYNYLQQTNHLRRLRYIIRLHHRKIVLELRAAAASRAVILRIRSASCRAEELRQLARLEERLRVVVAADMTALDPHVWYSLLPGHLEQRRLHLRAIGGHIHLADGHVVRVSGQTELVLE